VQVLFREACLPIAADLVFVAQPLAEPSYGVCIDRSVRFTDRGQGKSNWPTPPASDSVLRP
jgi:hypothetical protein